MLGLELVLDEALELFEVFKAKALGEIIIKFRRLGCANFLHLHFEDCCLAGEISRRVVFRESDV